MVDVSKLPIILQQPRAPAFRGWFSYTVYVSMPLAEGCRDPNTEAGLVVLFGVVKGCALEFGLFATLLNNKLHSVCLYRSCLIISTLQML